MNKRIEELGRENEALRAEVKRLKQLYRDPDDVMLLNQQQELIIGLTAEVERLRKALRYCAASAGLPDPVEACIGVIMGSKEALGETGKKEEI